MSYNKDTDYESKINEAVANGDYESAAEYEKSRNEKIDGENLSYKKTNRFSGWLDKTDYSNVLRDQMASGAPRNEVANTLNKRILKASGTEGLSHYAGDSVYEQAIRYIMGDSLYNGGKPSFKSSYDNELSRLYKMLSQIKEFKYDPYDDELYEYYKKQYIREGNRAMEDLLGELSSATGGVASSYAVSAAAQSRNNYNEKLTDIIPELYNDAYERYLDSIDRQERNFNLLSDMVSDEYDRYLDSLNQYNKDREFEYQKLLDEKELEYELDTAEYKRGQEKVETALRKWENMGYLDEESAKILGLPAGLHTTDYDYKKAQQYKIYNK